MKNESWPRRKCGEIKYCQHEGNEGNNRGRELAGLLESGSCDVIAFASPSAVRHCAALLAPLTLAAVRRRAAIAVIGPTTERAVRVDRGTEPDIVAREATARGLIDAIERYFSGQPA